MGETSLAVSSTLIDRIAPSSRSDQEKCSRLTDSTATLSKFRQLVLTGLGSRVRTVPGTRRMVSASHVAAAAMENLHETGTTRAGFPRVGLN